MSAPSIVRYGIVGYGLMGTEHARNLRVLDGRGYGARLTAVADPEAGSRGRAARHLGEGIRLFDDAAALAESGEVDVVVVASPNHTHREVLDALWGRPLHILVEKPLCTTLEDCARVRGMAARHDGRVWVGMEYRYMAPVSRLIDEVDSGTIGRPVMVAIREHRFPFLPKIGDWNRFNRNTGGTLVEKCCHFFDLMRRITRSEPRRVFASGAQDVNHLGERYGGRTPDILDNAYVVLDFEDGVRGLLDLCMFAEASLNEQEIAVTGDRGKVECFLPRSTVRIGRRADDDEIRGMRGDLVETIEVEIDDELRAAGHHHGSTFWQHVRFLEAIRGGNDVEITVEDGLRAVAVGLAAQRSIDEGRPIDVGY